MRTLSFLHRSLFVSFLLMCGAASATAENNWHAASRLIELPTPYGTLAVGDSEYIYEARLQLDGIEVKPSVSGLLSIDYAFSMPDSQVALVAIAQGNDACPVSYRWVILKADGYRVSPEFGSCSEQIRVNANTRQLTVQTPSLESPGNLDIYVYDGESVKKRTRPIK